MKTSTRYGLIVLSFIIFLVAAPILILYISGHSVSLNGLDSQATGILDAKSNPTATVSVEGKDRGSTPAIVRFLTQGEYEVTISKDGYYDWEKRLPIESGQVTYAQEGVDQIQLIKKSQPTVIFPSGANSFVLVDNVLWVASDHTLVRAPLSNIMSQTKITLPFTPTNVAPLRTQGYLLVSDSKNNIVFNTYTNTMFPVPFGRVAPESAVIAPDGTFLALTDQTLHAYTPSTKTDTALASDVVAMTMTGSTLYLAHENGTINTAIWNSGLSDFQNLITGQSFNPGNNSLIITNKKELFFKDSKGLLWKVNQSLEPVAANVESVRLDPDTDELTFRTASELWFYNFLAHRPQLLTRASSSAVADFKIRSDIGYGFVASQTGLEAIEIDSRDHQNRYQLLGDKSVWQIALTTNEKTILALENGSVVSLDIRN